MDFEFNQLGTDFSKHFLLRIGERVCISKVDLPVIIWKLNPIVIYSDLEIGAHLSYRSKSLRYSRVGKLKYISPDD